MKLNEIKSTNHTPVYISATGEWPDDDYNMLHGAAVYCVDIPTSSVEAVIKYIQDLDDTGDITDMIDYFEQDGWEPDGATGHAESLQLYDASTVRPSGKSGESVKKNYYTMVYFLRDAGLITQEYAESIATT